MLREEKVIIRVQQQPQPATTEEDSNNKHKQQPDITLFQEGPAGIRAGNYPDLVTGVSRVPVTTAIVDKIF